MGILRDYYSGGYSSPFGDPRPGGRKHRGQDLSHSSEPGKIGVPALRSGVVVGKTAPSNAHGFGHGITIRSRLDDGQLWDISYSHGPWASSQVVGEYVPAGKIILHEGRSGSTTGSCVHIEQRRVANGVYVDPLPEIKRIAARDNGNEGAPPPSVFQRTAKANSNGRTGPGTNYPVRDVLKAGTRGTFKATASGQVVEGNGLWIQGYFSGLWYWSGAFS
jgi:hypothetical protein